MMTFIWIVVAVLAFNTLLAFALMEFAVDHSKSASGVMYVKERSWVMRNLYLCNFLVEYDKRYPNDLCQLYWGLWGSTLLGGIIMYFYLIVLVVAFVGGRLVFANQVGVYGFRPYERYGRNNEKRWIAPWKILLAAAIGYVLFFHWDHVAIIAKNNVLPVSEIDVKIVLACVAVFGAFYALYKAAPKIRQAAQASPTIAFLKSIKGRFCLRVELTQ